VVVTSNQPRARYWVRWLGDSQSSSNASAPSLARPRRARAPLARRTMPASRDASTTTAAAATAHDTTADMAGL
jgi:hypothetical protein